MVFHTLVSNFAAVHDVDYELYEDEEGKCVRLTLHAARGTRELDLMVPTGVHTSVMERKMFFARLKEAWLNGSSQTST